MALTVIGVFDNATEAQRAVDALVSSTFSRNDVDLSTQTGHLTSGQSADTPAGTSDTGSGTSNFFRSLFGGDDDEADRYAQVADRGSVVTVHAQTDEDAERAADILDDNGAVDVNKRVPRLDSLTAAPSASMGAAITGTEPQQTDEQTIRVIEEHIEVGKRTVETGGVRLRSRIVARPVEERIRLREERVTLERTPLNRPATAADLNAFQEGSIEMTEHAEVAVVSKTASVVEEISIDREVTERDEVIHDTVRKTEVDIQDLTDKTGSDADGSTYSTK